MNQSESFDAIARHVREKLREAPEFHIRTVTLEETFQLEGPWYQDFQRWVADHGQPFYFRMGWQRSDGHPSGHVVFSVSDFE